MLLGSILLQEGSTLGILENIFNVNTYDVSLRWGMVVVVNLGKCPLPPSLPPFPQLTRNVLRYVQILV